VGWWGGGEGGGGERVFFRAERTQINTQLHQVGKLFHISNQNAR